MEDSVKGLYITLTVIFVFMMAILNFITLFPLEQGVYFNNSISPEEASQYLTMRTIDSNPQEILTSINNDSIQGFDQWDVTQGFMGSNTIKQNTKGGFTNQMNLIFGNLRIMAVSVFGVNSPIIIVLSIFLTAALGMIIYYVVKYVRTGI